jgi:hypothetical protein
MHERELLAAGRTNEVRRQLLAGGLVPELHPILVVDPGGRTVDLHALAGQRLTDCSNRARIVTAKVGAEVVDARAVPARAADPGWHYLAVLPVLPGDPADNRTA